MCVCEVRVCVCVCECVRVCVCVHSGGCVLRGIARQVLRISVNMCLAYFWQSGRLGDNNNLAFITIPTSAGDPVLQCRC